MSITAAQIRRRCVNGHTLDATNTYIYPDDSPMAGNYKCRTCNAEDAQKRREQKRGPQGPRLNRSELPDAGDMSWQDRALCADDLDWHDLSELDQKRICGNCPVHSECLSYALEYARRDPGVWGGYNASQRTRMLRRRAGLRGAARVHARAAQL